MENRTRTQVHMLPTEQSHIVKDIGHGDLKLIYFSDIKSTKGWYECQHLYITTDEEIKEGDWFINTNFQKIYQANSENSKNIIEFGPHPEIRKIIATTDKLGYCIDEKDGLTGYHLPQPSQAFIKKYCEQGGIDEVDVEYVRDMDSMQLNVDSKGEISSWYLKVDSHNTITTHRIVEKMYSIDDIEAYCEKYPNDTELGREIRKLRYKQ